MLIRNKKFARNFLGIFASYLFFFFSVSAYPASFQYGGIRHDTASTASSSGTLTLTNTSKQVQRITGSANHTVVLPDATTLTAGYWYVISNDSSGVVTVNANGGGNLTTLTVNQSATFYLMTATPAAGVWDVQAGSGGEGFGAGYELTNVTVGHSSGSNIMTVFLLGKDNQNPSAANKVKIGFRNSVGTDGSYVVREVTAATSLTVSAGSTLGTQNNVDAYLYVYAIDSSGTVELAISGTNQWDEGQLQDTVAEGGAGAADSGAVLYSTTSRSDVPIRLIGRIKSNEATAGNWNAGLLELSTWPFKKLGEASIQAGGEWYGSLVIGQASNCGSYVSGNDTDSYDNYTADTDCTNITATGQLTAASTKVPGFQMPADIKYRYLVIATGDFRSANNARVIGNRFSDGTVAFGETLGSTTASGQSAYGNVTGTYAPASSGTKTIQLQCTGIGSADTCELRIPTSAPLTFSVYRFTNNSNQTGDLFETGNFSGVSYTPASSWVSNATITGKYGRADEGMKLKLKALATGTPTDADLTFDLPTNFTFNGLSAGDAVGSATIVDDGTRSYVGTAIVLDSNSIRVVQPGTGNAGIVRGQGGHPFSFGSGDYVTVDVPTVAVSLNGAPWGTFPFGVNFAGRTYSAVIGGASEVTDCGSSPCTVYLQGASNWISSATRAGAGDYTVNVNPGYFNTAILCDVEVNNGIRITRVIRSGTSSVRVLLYTDAGGANDGAFNIFCRDAI